MTTENTPETPAKPSSPANEPEYFFPKPNKMFGPLVTAALRFAHYPSKVPCALCGKQRKKQWTCVVRFKAADMSAAQFQVSMCKQWIPAMSPVCSSHPMAPDADILNALAQGALEQFAPKLLEKLEAQQRDMQAERNLIGSMEG
jgi:hypothetical protein